MADLLTAIFDMADYLEGSGVDVSSAIKRRDPREPGRRRKEMAEEKIAAIYRKIFRKQRQAVIAKLDRYFPDRKAMPIPEDFYNPETDDIDMAALIRALQDAALDGVVLFGEEANFGLDYTLINSKAAEQARKYAGELVKNIDETTLDAVRRAVSGFVETPGMTIGDVVALLPFDEQRAMRIAVTEITRSYADGQMVAGRELQKQWPGVQIVKTWFTNFDDLVCAICGPNGKQGQIDIDDQFESGDESPPAHPNCRCWISTRTNLGGKNG